MFISVRGDSWMIFSHKDSASEGSKYELQKQINKCKNSDNFFLAIHTTFKNAGHLINSFIAEYCDLNRNLLTTEPRQGDPFFTVVCEFRKSNLRK